jgi:hypothetical protein
MPAEQVAKTRRLPSLYVYDYQVFADRREEPVLGRLRLSLDTALASRGESIFAMHACRFEGMIGIYARDLFNRSSYRRKLTRLGVSFADDPYVRFTGDGTFISRDLGEFRPEFVVLSSSAEDPKELVKAKGAWLAFNIAGLRLGQIDGAELAQLTEALSGVEAIGSGDAKVLAGALKSSP